MTDLRKAAEMALEFVEWFASDDHSIRPKDKAPKIAEAIRQALAQPESISYVPGFYRGEKISLSRVKIGERFILVRTGEIYSKVKHGYWCEFEQRPARLHLNCQVQVIEEKPPVKTYCGGKPNYCTPVDAVNTEQDQKTPLKVLNLTVFTENRLRNGRVYDVETLQAMTNRDILAIPDMGKKALGEVLEALDVYAINMSKKRVDETAKGEHEPVVWSDVVSDGGLDSRNAFDTAPPKREWVGLTDDDVHEAFNYVEMVKLLDFDRDRPEWCEAFARACEARLRHRNGEKQ